MMDLKTASPQEIAKYFSREVNNMFLSLIRSQGNRGIPDRWRIWTSAG